MIVTRRRERMVEEKTIEPQFQAQIDHKKAKGATSLGVKTSHTWHVDPRRLLFSFSRYKFVSKMFAGRRRVLEVGCGDAFCSRIVQQTVETLVAVDNDPLFIEDAIGRMDEDWPFEAKTHDMLAGPVDGDFDGAYALDVIEHIPPPKTELFLTNIRQSLTQNGAVIIGLPSLSSQQYASELSRKGHVNCMDAPDLKTVIEQHFRNVFIFSMNDEVLHTGFHPMSQYVFALGVTPLADD